MEKQKNRNRKKLSCASIRTITMLAMLRKPALLRVVKLQRRIAKAVKENRWGKVQSLQRILTRSLSAKIIAVLRVTANKGAKTAGVDKIIWKTDKDKINAVLSLSQRGYKPQPLRRIYIPKKDKTKLRPLSIPTMHDRAMQALYKLALEPVSEITADINSYGFRPYRSCADAIGQAFICLAKGYHAQWILEADIKSCFDQISHKWLLENIPMEKSILQKWLKAGYVENFRKFASNKGTPQGGIISPILMNMTLDGLEKAIRHKFPKGKKSGKVNLIRYADDFIITASSKEILVDIIKPLVIDFLNIRGLKLSEEKTKISHINEGFNFLSQNVRKYNGKLLIKPSEQAIKSFKQKIKQTVKQCRGHSAKMLISRLNPIIRGWVNFHKHVVSKLTFWKLSKYIFDKLMKWAKSEHSNKKIRWIFNKYFTSGDQEGRFAIRETDKKGKIRIFQLFAIGLVPIRRHVKIRANNYKFNPSFDQYFENRRKNKTKMSAITHQKLIYLAN